MKSFNAFVFPDLSGAVLVHDRYLNYDAVPSMLHQLCTQHILRDLEDAAQCYPDAIWPGQAADALRGLSHSANTARGNGPARVLGDGTAADLVLFRNAARRRKPPGRTLPASLPDGLSQREAEILSMIAQGMTNPDIAAELYLSAHTVKTNINRIFAKTRSADSAAAIRYARDHQLG
jgi:DNA-binding CsgD family transcriptional regulator